MDVQGILHDLFLSFIEPSLMDWVKWIAMWLIGGILIYLAIKRDMEPALLLPMGFGAILVNLPFSGAITQGLQDGITRIGVAKGGEVGEVFYDQIGDVVGGVEIGPLNVLFEAGIANELFPLLLFIGIGAMIDFGPLLSNPKLFFFGAAAQFGIFMTLSLSVLLGFEWPDAASISIIGAADGPTAIYVSNRLNSQYAPAILVAAYSYMALVPMIQPPVIRAITTKAERSIKMPAASKSVSRLTRIIFPITVTIVAGIIAPKSVALVGFLMFGNLIRECGCLGSLSETAQGAFANIITLLLGFTIALKLHADAFLRWETIMIMGLGLIAFIFDTVGGVMLGKLFNVFSKQKVNPMIGAAGISAFPMSA
ncbi:MAG: sodium ion-translocating decarboxylase subunit beta, partial [Lachnospiraceae bacterium]|nr:sodium ion-translocating decarboxylase subunit beta [Lachnospiraceae bacterium]